VESGAWSASSRRSPSRRPPPRPLRARPARPSSRRPPPRSMPSPAAAPAPDTAQEDVGQIPRTELLNDGLLPQLAGREVKAADGAAAVALRCRQRTARRGGRVGESGDPRRVFGFRVHDDVGSSRVTRGGTARVANRHAEGLRTGGGPAAFSFFSLSAPHPIF